jgi:hypothetical protein
MNLEYLQKEILPQRKLEIETGENLWTAHPIYVVLESITAIVSGHSDYSPPTDMQNTPMEYGYIDLSLEPEDREFQLESEGMTEPDSITRFRVDRPAAFFLTHKAAKEYVQYQSHNLIEPYVYVFNAGYRNIQMDNLLRDE